MPEFDLDQDKLPRRFDVTADFAAGRADTAELTDGSLSEQVDIVFVMHRLRNAMKGYRALAASGLIVALAGSVWAEATRDKCTCDLRTSGDRSDGAEVRNAAACYLSVDANRDWCSFDVSALNGSQRYQMVLLETANRFQETNDPVQALEPLISEYLSRPDVEVNLAMRFDVKAVMALEQAKRATEDNKDLLAACLDAFFARKPGDFQVLQSGDGLACGVDPETGWLNLEYRFDTWLLIFLTEPLRP